MKHHFNNVIVQHDNRGHLGSDSDSDNSNYAKSSRTDSVMSGSEEAEPKKVVKNCKKKVYNEKNSKVHINTRPSLMKNGLTNTRNKKVNH